MLLVAYTLLLTVLSESWLAIITGLIKGSADACSNIGVPFAVAVRAVSVFQKSRHSCLITTMSHQRIWGNRS